MINRKTKQKQTTNKNKQQTKTEGSANGGVSSRDHW